MNPSDISAIKDQALSECRGAASLKELEAVRIKYLSRRGVVQSLMKDLKRVPSDKRAEAGRAANELKSELNNLLKTRKSDFESAGAAMGPEQSFDYTLPGTWRSIGSRHPLSLVIEESARIFSLLGFTMADGPDIETEYYNFDALNTPADHPSRDIQDTFWLESGELLRTQTSPVQIRVMEKNRPPVRVIAPGRCYRRDTADATHSACFHQIEGLYVDRDVSMRDLKSDITYFARRMIGPEVKVRFRPHFFPFTEPSVEYDFSCHACGGRGCKICKNKGWIEISGAGMVNPAVLETVGYDPESVSGYAFGMGVERIAMIKYGIDDMRLFYENDLRFLKQFARPGNKSA
ncbi:MAG: phenylalanine--tRNA ligase subunit alpha [Kiritimatiellia bacterium]